MQLQNNNNQGPPEGFSYFSPEQRNELRAMIQEEAQNIVRQAIPMIYTNVQKMSLVKAARIFFFPTFTTDRLRAFADIDQNFDLTDQQRQAEKQKFDQKWETEFSKFFAEKKLTLPSGYRGWVECMISVNLDLDRFNTEVTKKQLIDDPLFNNFVKDICRGETMMVENNNAPSSTTTGAVRRDRELLPHQLEVQQHQQQQQHQRVTKNNQSHHEAPQNSAAAAAILQRPPPQQQDQPYAIVEHDAPYWSYLSKSNWLSVDQQGRLCWGDKKNRAGIRDLLPSLNVVGDPNWFKHEGCVKCLFNGYYDQANHAEFKCNFYSGWNHNLRTFPRK